MPATWFQDVRHARSTVQLSLAVGQARLNLILLTAVRLLLAMVLLEKARSILFWWQAHGRQFWGTLPFKSLESVRISTYGIP